MFVLACIDRNEHAPGGRRTPSYSSQASAVTAAAPGPPSPVSDPNGP